MHRLPSLPPSQRAAYRSVAIGSLTVTTTLLVGGLVAFPAWGAQAFVPAAVAAAWGLILQWRVQRTGAAGRARWCAWWRDLVLGVVSVAATALILASAGGTLWDSLQQLLAP